MTKARDLSKLADGTEFTAADHSKLDGIEASATADQTSAQIKAAVEAATDSNVFTDADHSKLNAVEASADVTDATNVTAAGALMDSELTNLAAVKAINQSLVTTAAPTFAGLATTANVGIGTDSAACALHIDAPDNGAIVAIFDTDNSGSKLIFRNNSTTGNNTQIGAEGNDLVAFTGGSERMRISSGNVLVGKTTSSIATAGTALRGDNPGLINSVRAGTILELNRLTTDGSIVDLYKDGSPVGNIGTFGGTTYFSSNSHAIMINGTAVTPSTNTGSRVDNAMDLGASSYRFKDLYLSGGVVFGPASGSTVSSQTLDDYETGSITVSEIHGQTSITTNRANYTKIGNLVFVSYSITVAANTNSNALNLSLPFSSTINGYYLGGGSVSYNNLSTSLNVNLRPQIENAASNVFFYYNVDTILTCASASGNRIDFQVMYQVNA
jgi:hypothetical protein